MNRQLQRKLKCIKCKEHKERDLFEKSEVSGKLSRICSDCPKTPATNIPGKLTCHKCKILKKNNCFSFESIGISSWRVCKKCASTKKIIYIAPVERTDVVENKELDLKIGNYLRKLHLIYPNCKKNSWVFHAA